MGNVFPKLVLTSLKRVLNDIRNYTYNRVQLADTFGKLTVSIHLDHENRT